MNLPNTLLRNHSSLAHALPTTSSSDLNARSSVTPAASFSVLQYASDQRCKQRSCSDQTIKKEIREIKIKKSISSGRPLKLAGSTYSSTDVPHSVLAASFSLDSTEHLLELTALERCSLEVSQFVGRRLAAGSSSSGRNVLESLVDVVVTICCCGSRIAYLLVLCTATIR
jgi:hypothetical protein